MPIELFACYSSLLPLCCHISHTSDRTTYLFCASSPLSCLAALYLELRLLRYTVQRRLVTRLYCVCVRRRTGHMNVSDLGILA